MRAICIYLFVLNIVYLLFMNDLKALIHMNCFLAFVQELLFNMYGDNESPCKQLIFEETQPT